MDDIELTDHHNQRKDQPGPSPGAGKAELSPTSPAQASSSAQQPINSGPQTDKTNPPMLTTNDPEPGLTKQEKREQWKYRFRMFAGLFLPFFLDSTDITIIATALPHIAADFGRWFPIDIYLLNWYD